MGIPVEGEGAITIAELHQDRRGLRIALRYAPIGEKAFLALANHGIDQPYRHVNDQLADCRASALPPMPPGTALTGHTDIGPDATLFPGLGRFWLLDLLSSRSRLCRLPCRSGPLVCGM
jgi:hypothetical protein